MLPRAALRADEGHLCRDSRWRGCAPGSPRPRTPRRLLRAASGARHGEAGASAIRIRPSACSCQRRCRSTPASMPARHGSCSRAGASPPSSIRHLPTVARMPVGAMASSTASVSCTVSIVSTVVVPVRSSSWTASRVEAASVAGVCAASSGHTRCLSHSSSGRSSARPRNRVWHRWTWVWMKPGGGSRRRRRSRDRRRRPGRRRAGPTRGSPRPRSTRPR